MFDSVLNSVISTLEDEGIPAVRKYPGCVLDRSTAAVAVSLKAGSITASGYGNYMGIYEKNGDIKELYGHRAELKIGMEIYTPAAADKAEIQCTKLLNDICSCIGGISGVKLKSFEGGEAKYDSETEMFRCESTVEVTVYLVCNREERGRFTDFVLKGELK
ncbi:MAG: hypothetical protein Q4A83_01015 [Bacillota bacterium]|nr:hypothetical protein [Bacillota bacterium]